MTIQTGANRVLFTSFLAYSLSANFAPPIFAQDQANQFQPAVVLPRPEPKFKGHIGTTYKDSQPDKIPLITAPKDAPNVLLILIDDCGYGQWGTFGGQIPTPTGVEFSLGRQNGFPSCTFGSELSPAQ